jgi:hypothetical protein
VPAFYRIDPQLKLVFSIFRDTLTDSDLQEHIEKLCSDPEFDPDFAELIDCSAVTDFKVSSGLISKLAGQPLGSVRSKWAIVAPQAHIFGMARMFQIQHNDEQVEVFRDADAARQWFGIGK